MTIKNQIHKILEQNFTPESLEVINETALHQGHAGDDGSGESHFRIRIQAVSLRSMSRLARHRAIYQALDDEIIAHIHALAIEAG